MIPTTLAFLAAHAEWMMHRPEAEDIYGELTYATGLIAQVIDVHASQSYAGPCDVCKRDMYATVGAEEVECKPCALVYDMKDRREWLLKAAEDRLERAADISRAVAGFGYDVTRLRIGKWAQRGQIVAHSRDEAGRPLYRVGDVIDLVQKDRERRLTA